MAHQRGVEDNGSVELILRPLQLDVSDEHAGERPAEDEAHGDDAGGGGQEAEAKAQEVPASSRR